MIAHGRKQISEMVYARRASEGGGAVRLTNMIRGGAVVFGGLKPSFKWLTGATKRAILAAFGVSDGTAVIKATNRYLNVLAATDPTKAQALAGYINEDPMMVCSLGLSVEGVTMPIRYLDFADGGKIAMPRLLTTNDQIEYSCFGEFLLFGRTGGAGAPGFAIRHMIGSVNIYAIQQYVSWASVFSPINATTEYHVRLNMSTKKMTVDGFTGERNFDWSGLQTICNLASVSMVKLKLRYLNISELQYIPFVSETREGLLDLGSMTLNPNIDTGKPKAYYLRNGQPWTPLNQQ